MLRHLTVTITTLLIFLGGCANDQQEPTAKDTPKIVKILHLNTTASYTRSAEFPAEIYASKDTTMAFEVSGKIVTFTVEEGERVQKGDVIAALDDTIFQANYASALANYAQAQTDYERYEALYQARGVSKADFEKFEQNLKNTQAQYKIAQKNLANTKLVAEFDGIMAKKLVNDFARINAKQPILRLQDNSAFKVKFFAPEKEVVSIKAELTPQELSKHIDFHVFLSDLPQEVFTATLLSISTTAEKVTRTFEATLLIKPKAGVNLLPGMSAKVRAVAKEVQPDSILIPYKALFTNDTNKTFVWKVNSEQRVLKQEVNLGKITGEHVEVLQGLTNEDKIVTSGVGFLNSGDAVQTYKKQGN